MPTSPSDNILLRKANKKIAYLIEDIRRLSVELQKKEVLLSGLSEKLREKEKLVADFSDLAIGQSRRISTLTAAVQDTVVWDPSYQRTPISSTPSSQPWTMVSTRGRGNRSRESVPPLCLLNRYSALAGADLQDTQPGAPSDVLGNLASPSSTAEDGLTSLVPGVGAVAVASGTGVSAVATAVPSAQPGANVLISSASAGCGGSTSTLPAQRVAPPAVACQAPASVHCGAAAADMAPPTAAQAGVPGAVATSPLTARPSSEEVSAIAISVSGVDSGVAVRLACQPAAQRNNSAAQRRLLRKAVSRRSGALPNLDAPWGPKV